MIEQRRFAGAHAADEGDRPPIPFEAVKQPPQVAAQLDQAVRGDDALEFAQQAYLVAGLVEAGETRGKVAAEAGFEIGEQLGEHGADLGPQLGCSRGGGGVDGAVAAEVVGAKVFQRDVDGHERAAQIPKCADFRRTHGNGARIERGANRAA